MFSAKNTPTPPSGNARTPEELRRLQEQGGVYDAPQFDQGLDYLNFDPAILAPSPTPSLPDLDLPFLDKAVKEAHAARLPPPHLTKEKMDKIMPVLDEIFGDQETNEAIRTERADARRLQLVIEFMKALREAVPVSVIPEIRLYDVHLVCDRLKDRKGPEGLTPGQKELFDMIGGALPLDDLRWCGRA